MSDSEQQFDGNCGGESLCFSSLPRGSAGIELDLAIYTRYI